MLGFSIRAYFAVVLGMVLLSANAHAVSMNFSGSFRSEATTYQNLNLGSGAGPTKNFISSRALLYPNLVIDDHFSLKSQWSLLTSPNFTPDATVPLGVGQGGWVYGDPNTTALRLSRAWLEWTSDVGVFRIGRMPVAWGYGLVYDAGLNTWDDFQTTFDRFEYRLHLGYVVGALAYSKGRKLSPLADTNDQQFMVAYLQYNNPESEVEAGLLFEKQDRSPNQAADLMGAANPYVGTNSPLATKTSWPLSNNFVDVYVKKTSGAFTVGGEFAWFTGSATDYGGVGSNDLNAMGATFNMSYDFGKAKAFAELLYVTGDDNLNDSKATAFAPLNRNRRPGLILGRELLGNLNNGSVGQGGLVLYGPTDTFSGAMYFRPGLRIDWSTSWATGLELIWARKTVSVGNSSNLGLEVDLGVEHQIYKNFGLGANFGYLLAGEGLGVANPTNPIAVRATAVVSF